MKLILDVNSLKGLKFENTSLHKDNSAKNDFILRIVYDNIILASIDYQKGVYIGVDFEDCWRGELVREEFLNLLNIANSTIRDIERECWVTLLENLEEDVLNGVINEECLHIEFSYNFGDILSSDVEEWNFKWEN